VRQSRLCVRALALVLGVGVVALLIGLSVAPQFLPSDTVRLTPRVAAGAMVDKAADPDGTYLNAADTVQMFAAGIHTIAPALLVLPADSLRLGLADQRRLALAAAIPLARGCRGPPSAA
jgi:hypothetical protein